ncbi:MAG TPA: amino acid ABC transporter substrate-binding protein [Stellaceae bacterium]|nr:amino acid ABC transporter substrate-binding protein [Stellaceae bacterium]
MRWISRFGAVALLSMLALLQWSAQAAEPIKIGFSMALTGGLAPNGKSALVAMQLWEKDVNAKGGILGRPVQLVYYDDQSQPSTVPAIYTKLLDVDKVDFVVGPYATAQIAPAMPIVMQRNLVFITLLGLSVNDAFHYPRYFQIAPNGSGTKAFTKGFFDLAAAQNPKPQTLAIAYADQQYAHASADGALANGQAAGFKVVYDKSYPPTTADFSPIIRAVAATNPDLFVIASYPPDSVGMVHALREQNFTPKMVGAGMVGLQATALKTQLGPLLNGIVNYDFWLPGPKMQFDGVMDVLHRYQGEASKQGVDPLGYYMVPWAYAYLQVLQQSIEATKGLDQDKIAKYMHEATFKTVAGDVKFGEDGEWATPRMLQVQYQHVTSNDVEQFRDPKNDVILEPSQYADGKLIYPYADALK